MDKKSVTNLVLLRLNEILSEISKQKVIDIPKTLDETTRLIGKKAVLDSLSLVNLIISVEQEINDKYGLSITIADDRAMSMEKSPFRSVGSLSDYIWFLIEEQTQAPPSAGGP